MADGRKKNGGARAGSGRKPKSEEQALIEKLQPHDDTAISTLIDLVKSGDVRALTLFMSYRFGKPKETKDINLEVEKNFPDWLNE